MINSLVSRVQGIGDIGEGRREEVAYWLNHNLHNFLRRGGHIEFQQAEHIVDYLLSSDAPTRLRSMAVEAASRKADEWNKTQQKRGRHIAETDADVEAMPVEGLRNGRILVRLVGKAAYLREGHCMGHCVASYYGRTESTIYSLRDAANNPHCTFEVTTGANRQVQQIKGKGNGSIHPKYINDVLAVLRHFDLQISPGDMTNLGYVAYSSQTMCLLAEKGVQLRTLTYGGRQYVFAGK